MIVDTIRGLLPEDSRLTIKLSLKAASRASNLDSVEDLVDWLLEENVQRDSLFVSMGGGVVGDLTGFISSIYTLEVLILCMYQLIFCHCVILQWVEIDRCQYT